MVQIVNQELLKHITFLFDGRANAVLGSNDDKISYLKKQKYWYH